MKPDKIKIEDLEVFANHGVRLCIRIPDGQD